MICLLFEFVSENRNMKVLNFWISLKVGLIIMFML